IFNRTKEEKRNYQNSLETNDNLVVRVNSIPKKAFSIFKLQPKNKNVEPLFKWIPEHKKNDKG
ncbi:hypothetical protein, partial [Candidatus Parabeggiatoa sp. HSG14]|uniref:hypothetical protein n=1 Tax=Candidatus Parabeggiatoa sp. HSG14 TaxID=3055593 RepID=UPI0025A7FCC3|nr:hypothetical protein [Thiotrichales bacterium HSG14]